MCAGVGKTVKIQELINNIARTRWFICVRWCRVKEQERNDLLREMLESGIIKYGDGLCTLWKTVDGIFSKVDLEEMKDF